VSEFILIAAFVVPVVACLQGVFVIVVVSVLLAKRVGEYSVDGWG